MLTFGIHAIRTDVGDLMDSVLRRHWCFRELRFSMFLQKTQHLDVGRTRKVQRPTLLHNLLQYSRPLPIGAHLSPLLVYKSDPVPSRLSGDNVEIIELQDRVYTMQLEHQG